MSTYLQSSTFGPINLSIFFETRQMCLMYGKNFKFQQRENTKNTFVQNRYEIILNFKP